MKKLLLIFLVSINIIQAQVITTVAGDSLTGYSGDGGQATSAELQLPVGVAVDKSNNLYIADYYNHVIRKVDHNTGIISTVAGTGNSGYSGDNGPAIAADLYSPYAVAVDTAGNLYIADMDENRLRKVNYLTGIITTIAGTGVGGYSGDGGLAISAELNQPDFITLDALGNIYFSQGLENVVRKINSSNGIITTVAGNGNAGYSGDGGLAINAELNAPFDIILDSALNLFIADYKNNCIRRVSSNGIISTFAGTGNTTFSGDGGPATNANLNGPWGLGIDKTGNIYIADVFNQRIRKVDINSGIINTITGNCLSNCIPYGDFSGDGGLATLAELNVPTDVCFDVLGNLYIADSHNWRVRKVSNTSTTNILQTNISQIAISPNPSNGNFILQNSNELGLISVYNTLGELIYQKTVKENNAQIDISNQSNGTYLLRIGNNFTKIIKY
jgi:hypothetical protein